MGWGMAEVTVFVDDAVLGRLPQVCAKHGTPTGSRLRIVEEVGRSNRLGLLWLLALAGPLGWVVLIVLASRDSGEHLAVEVPLSEAAYDELTAGTRLRLAAVVGGAVAVVALFLLGAWAQLGALGLVLLVGAAVAALVAVLVAERRIGRASVGVSLDASRRWVTLTGVHPAFAAAFREQQAERTVRP